LIDPTASTSTVSDAYAACRSPLRGLSGYGSRPVLSADAHVRCPSTRQRVQRGALDLALTFMYRLSGTGRRALARFLPTHSSATRAMSSSKHLNRQAPLILAPKEAVALAKDEAASNPVAFVDASWHMPNSPRKAREEFLQQRLPGAQFFDLDEVASAHELGLKHMMPSGQVLASALRACSQDVYFGFPASRVVRVSWDYAPHARRIVSDVCCVRDFWSVLKMSFLAMTLPACFRPRGRYSR
jgi:hypothetical protein